MMYDDWQMMDIGMSCAGCAKYGRNESRNHHKINAGKKGF